MAVIGESAEQILATTEASNNEIIRDSIIKMAHGLVYDAGKVKRGEKVLIWFDKPGVEMAKEMNRLCREIGAEVQLFMRDYEGDAATLAEIDEDQVDALFEHELELVNWAENILIVRNPDDPEALSKVPIEKKPNVAAYLEKYNQIHTRRSNGEVLWSLFKFPTQYEADKEGLSLADYTQLVAEACDQPWAEIYQAQEKLKQLVDAGKTLTFIANEDDADESRRTSVTMSIEGMTFCNSTIDSNYPGSEAFSAPILYSVNGHIFAEGEYLYDGQLIKDIYLDIANGQIVSAWAEENNQGLQEILNRNVSEQGFGSRYFGECAMGTNPGLTKRLFNSLLNEKVSGSFHMAIGHCYTYKTYGGRPVNVNNGNTEEKTSVHWDVTIPMRRKADGTGGGRIIVDGQTIQQDGQFLDPDLANLNPKAA